MIGGWKLGSSWELKIDIEKLQEEKMIPQKKIKNHFDAARGLRSDKKGNEDDKKKPKRAPESLLHPLGSHLELPMSPQDLQKCPQEAFKSIQNEPKRVPRRSQDHLRIEDVDFSKIELPPRRELVF